MEAHEELIKKVKDFISKSQTDKAIDLLEKENLSHHEVDIINLSSRYSKLTSDTRRGIIDNENAQLTLNKINISILELLKVIEETPTADQQKDTSKTIQKTIKKDKSNINIVKKATEVNTPPKNIPTKSNSIKYIMLIGALLLGALAIAWGIKSNAKKEKEKTEAAAKKAAAAAKAKLAKEEKKKIYDEAMATFEKEKEKIKLGKKYRGGIIFYVDDTGLKGLIAARGDATPRGKIIPWMKKGESLVQAGAYDEGIYGGKSNTKILVKKFGEGNYPAKLCDDFIVEVNGKKNDDWYLPSQYELDLLYDYTHTQGTTPLNMTNKYYWSSTEISNRDVYYRSFHNGKSYRLVERNQGKVRPISMFELKPPKKE